jgi:MFS family permease
MLFTAQDWLVLQLSHNSPTALGVVTALQFLPVLLLTLHGGQLADRYDKRVLLMISNAGSAVVAGLLGFLVVSGAVQLWHIFVTAGLFGIIAALETPARQSFFSELVQPELLPNALSLSSATFNSARTVGPAVAGVLIAWVDTGPVFLVTAVMCIAPILGLARMRAADMFRVERTAVPVSEAKIVDGLKYVWQRPDLSQAIALVMLVGLFGFNFQLTLAVLAKTTFHSDARHFGLMSTALAIGALAGALSGSRRKVRPSIYLVVTAASLFGALETIVGFAPTYVIALGLLMPTGYFMIFFAQAANQRVQLGVDPEFRGRVMALYVLVFLGTTPIGSLVMGWLSASVGPRSGLWAGGILSLIAAVTIAVLQVRRTGGQVRLHLKPSPHVHVFEPARKGTPAVDLRVPKGRDSSLEAA